MAENLRDSASSDRMRIDIAPDSPREEQAIVNDTTIDCDDATERGTIQAFGYIPAYRRVLGAWVGVCIVMALSSPLGAIMISGSYQIEFAGYWGLSWGWIIPNVMLLPQVIAVAELCSSMPVNGGFYWWAAALAPDRASRPVGFITGWFNVLALATGLAAFAYAIAAGFTQALSFVVDGFMPTLPQLMGISMAVITLWAGLMVFKLERVSLILVITATVLFCSSIGFIVALPIVHSQQNLQFASAKDVFSNFSNASEWPEVGIAVPFSFYGALFVNSIWTAPAYVAEETQDARRESPKAIIQSFCCTAILGLGICLTFAFCISDMEILQKDKTGYPLFVVINEHFGPKATGPFLLVGSIFSTIGGSGMLLTYATQVAAFARDGGLPYSSYLSQVHKRTNMPLAAAALLVVLTYLFLLLALSQHASDIVYSMATLASLIIWTVPVCLRLFAGERWIPGAFYTGRFSWSIHCLSVVCSVYLLITRSIPPTKDTPPLNVVIVIIVLVLSISAYYFCSKNFRGLDLAALQAWRYHNCQSIEGVVDFAEVVRQSTVDQDTNKRGDSR